MRSPFLAVGVAFTLWLSGAGLAQAQGMPGATVGLPMGSPDPFGLSTVNRPADPAAEQRIDPAERRIGARPQRRLKSHRSAAPKRRAAPTARR